MSKRVLLIVDVQTALVEAHPARERETLGAIRTLRRAAYAGGIETIFVRHDDGPGGELEQGRPGWELWRGLAPEPDERVFDKRFNSAFRQTGLLEYLRGRRTEELVLVGMQTEYCIDATCKAAFEYGFRVVIPAGATTTFPNGELSAEALQALYEERIWNRRFAQVLPLAQVLARLPT